MASNAITDSTNEEGSNSCRSLHEGVKKLFDNEKYSDFKIKCGSREWKVHKAVVCTQFEAFAKAYDFGQKETQENAYTFDAEEKPSTVHAMLEFLYTTDFDTASADSALYLSIDVFHLACCYLQMPLKELALQKFEALIRTDWYTAEFASIIDLLYKPSYKNTDELKAILIKVTREHAAGLFCHPETYPDFHRIAREAPDFLADVFTGNTQLKNPATQTKWYSCPKCSSCLEWAKVVTFGMPADAPSNLQIGCAGGCHTEPLSWWEKHEVSF